MGVKHRTRLVGGTIMNYREEKWLDNVVRHVNKVRDDCLLLGKRLTTKGEEKLGLDLIANGIKHDYSKFVGIEWLYLHDEIREENLSLFQIAHESHVKGNPHHPEYWGSIYEMPRLYIAEMCCDWHTRASEFGTGLKEWIINNASERFLFSTTNRDKVYKEIKYFLSMLLDEPFSNPKKVAVKEKVG